MNMLSRVHELLALEQLVENHERGLEAEFVSAEVKQVLRQFIGISVLGFPYSQVLVQITKLHQSNLSGHYCPQYALNHCTLLI